MDFHHTGTKTEMAQVDDGRFHHCFGSSWIKTSDICLERARREMTGEMPDVQTDAASVGTAVHSAIETGLNARKDGYQFDRTELVELFQMEFSLLMADPTFAWIKYRERSARSFGAKCVTHFYNEVWHTIPDEVTLEQTFVLPFYEDDERAIELSGAIDLVLPTRIGDFKTSGRGPYEEWQYKRWAVQPTVYTWAFSELGLLGSAPPSVDFEYVVMHPHGVQRFTVTRNDSDWSFLEDKVLRLAKLIECGPSEWPLNDNHALCSEKWCPAHSTCKGSH